MNRENSSSTASTSSSQVNNSDWDQQNECSVCLGKYEDDIIDDELQNEWICCSGCGNWVHADCLVAENSAFVCVCCAITS